jgi:hypothetical protein
MRNNKTAVNSPTALSSTAVSKTGLSSTSASATALATALEQTPSEQLGSRPQVRPLHTRRTPQSRMPGEVSNPRPRPRDPSNPRPRPHRLLGHALTSPQKRTLKRIEALRGGLFDGGFLIDEVRTRVTSLLFDDRELRSAITRNALEELTDILLDPTLGGQTTADLVGAFLRDLGAMQRPELSAPRVKNALRALNDVLFGDDQSHVIAKGVREFKLEKRDGGLQIVAVLRKTASFDGIRAAADAVLKAEGLKEIDVRIER